MQQFFQLSRISCLSKFLNPSPLRSEIGHLFHPSIHPRFPHFRFAMHGASFPSPLRSPLWWTGAQDTRGEGAKLRKRRKATAGNATKCEVRWAHTKEGTARVERAGAIGRNLPLRPEKGTKRKKRARVGKDEGSSATGNDTCGACDSFITPVSFFIHRDYPINISSFIDSECFFWKG